MSGIIGGIKGTMKKKVSTQAGGDANWSNVSLLLKGDGSNGSTTIVDSSGSPKTISSAATIDTSTYKFGTGAIRTSPTGSKFAAITNTSDLDLSGDYTVECWVYMVSTQSYGGIFANGISGNSSGVGQFVLSVNSNSIITYINGTTASVTSNTSLSLNTWTHLAVTMSGTTLTIWVNGVNTGSTTYSGSRGSPFTYSTLGRWYYGTDNYYFDGYIDEFRITKGVARYTTNFTPATSAFPTSASSGPSGTPGLRGKRYTGYHGEVPSWYDTATEYGETNTLTNINRFSSSSDYSSVNNYSWQWVGYFYAPTSGSYTFYTSSDDGSYLWVGASATSGYTTSNCLVNNGGGHGVTEVSGTISLTAGTYYPIRVQFGEMSGGDEITVSFTPPGGSKTTNGTNYYFV